MCLNVTIMKIKLLNTKMSTIKGNHLLCSNVAFKCLH